MLRDIPSFIGNAKTLFISEVTESLELVVRDEKKIEITFIAVCQYNSKEGFYLFSCDKAFNTYSDYWYDDLEDALDDAKRIYKPENINWQPAKKLRLGQNNNGRDATVFVIQEDKTLKMIGSKVKTKKK